MGRRDRERVQRILDGKEAPVRHSLSEFSQKLVAKAEALAEKGIRKVLVPKWLKMSLPQQVAVARKVVRTAGVINFRADFLKPDGFPSDIRSKKEEGWTGEQIRDYYWNCPEWVEFWTSLGLNEDHFRELLPEDAHHE